MIYFENLDNDLISELRDEKTKKLNGGGWKFLAEFLQKNPKHEGVRVAIDKMKEEINNKKLSEVPDEANKRSNKKKKITLEDFLTCCEAIDSEYVKHIETNVKELE